MTWAEMCGYKNGNEGGTSDVEEKELSWLMEWNGLRCFFSLFFFSSIHIQLQSEAAKAADAVKHRLARSRERMSGQTKWTWKSSAE